MSTPPRSHKPAHKPAHKSARKPADAPGDKTGLAERRRPERIQAAALEVLALVLEEGQLADRALSRVLRRERTLFSGERRAVAEAVYGLLRREQGLRAGLQRGLGAKALSDFPSSQIHAAMLAGHWLLEGQTFDLKLTGALQRAISELPSAVEANLAGAATPESQAALRHSLPDWLAQRLTAEIGAAETEALFAALNQRAPLTLRTNLLKGTREALLAELTQGGIGADLTPLSPWGLTLAENTNVFGLPQFKQGWFEVQDEGSQLLALLCRARPGQIVVDACAGGGGKTLALAAEMRNKGELWALDSNAKRLAQLRPRTRRAQAHNVRSALIPATGPFPEAVAQLSGKAHAVLVDAPCSGIGALRRNPDARRRLTEASIAEHAGLQRAILRRMAELVRPGGLLVYATCSVLQAENEAVVASFLEGAGFAPVSPRELLGGPVHAAIAARGPAGSETALRLWPQHQGTDGFFGVGLRREG